MTASRRFVGGQIRTPIDLPETPVYRFNPCRFQKFRTTLATAVIAAGLACAANPTASAQVSRGGMASLFIPDFLPRDLPVFVDALALEEWQRPILETLLDDYKTNFDTAAEGVRASMGGLKDVAASTSPDKIIELISKPLVSWSDEKKKLRGDFLDSVRSQLSDVQLESWPRLERALRREKALPNGELSGEALNLVLIAREIDAPPIVADGAAAAIDAYEVQLDEALAAREAELESTIASKLRAMQPGDNRELLQIEERIMQRRIAVRQAQEAGISTIRDALGSEFGPKFEKRALRRAFPQVYGPDPVTPLFDAALALTDLTPEQTTQLTDLRNSFETEHGALQVRFANAIRTTEPDEPKRRAEMLAAKAAGGSPRFSEPAEIEAIKNQRQEFYSRMRASIAEILNDSQKELVPGFGKPGAGITEGQKYQDAVRLGTGGVSPAGTTKGSAGGATPAADVEGIDPAVKPGKGGGPTMDDTKPGAAKPPKSPKQE